MNNIQKMACRVQNELLAAYENKYFEATSAEQMTIEMDYARYEVILDWAALCSEAEYNKLQDVDNDYDVAFNRGRDAAISIIFD